MSAATSEALDYVYNAVFSGHGNGQLSPTVNVRMTFSGGLCFRSFTVALRPQRPQGLLGTGLCFRSSGDVLYLMLGLLYGDLCFRSKWRRFVPDAGPVIWRSMFQV